MGLNRLRAKKPVRKADKWKKAVISEVKMDKNRIKFENGEEIQVTSEIFELVNSRIEGEIEGSKAWYIKS